MARSEATTPSRRAARCGGPVLDRHTAVGLAELDDDEGLVRLADVEPGIVARTKRFCRKAIRNRDTANHVPAVQWADSREAGIKPPSDHLYGRVRGHALRPRQRWLLEHLLPRLRANAADPFGGWDGERWLEIGFGGGEHAWAQAQAHPEAMLIACEVFQNGICSLLSRMAPEGAEPNLPANLRIFDGDARVLLRALPDGALDRLFLLFPDPWPKARHAKRRFVHPATLPEVARVLRRGAEWRIASDDPTYQAWVHTVFWRQPFFDAGAAVAVRPQGWPQTRYEARRSPRGGRHNFGPYSRL